MAIQQYTNATYAVTNNWEDETIIKDLLKRGAYRVDFSTLYSSATLNIAAGSYCDVDGVIYYFDASTAVPTPGGTGTYYLYLDVSSTPALSVSASAPSYDIGRHGYYNGVTARALAQFDYSASTYSNIFPLSNQLGSGIITANALVRTEDLDVLGASAFDGQVDFNADIDINSTSTFTGQVDFNGDVDINSTSTFTGTATFNGTILDKNGNEVLSLQAESVANTTNFGSGSASYSVNTTHTFTNEVLGVAFITGFYYNNNLTRIDGINPQYKYTIGGTGNKTVTVTSLATLGSTSYTGYVTCYVTALTR